MRIFTDTVTMIEEIRRDLAKSPLLVSERVQAVEGERKVHEAMNYSYSIPESAMPNDAYLLAKFGAEYFPDSFWQDIPAQVAWLAIEDSNRFQPLSATARLADQPSETYHNELALHIEGSHYSYTYRERMIGMLPSMESVLMRDPYSRRAFWPIYEQRDSHRASDMTRIPCTLGYWFCIRDIALKGQVLHVTNYQRSCDFEKFFLTDLWFTCRAQRLLAERLDIPCGNIVHNIGSFHSFVRDEIY